MLIYRSFQKPRRPMKKRERLWLASGGVCIYCGRLTLLYLPPPSVPHDPGLLATVEHLLPKSEGGGNGWDNIALACIRCNAAQAGNVWNPPRAGAQKLPGIYAPATDEDVKRWMSHLPPLKPENATPTVKEGIPLSTPEPAPAVTFGAARDSIGSDLAGPAIGSTSDCRIPGCAEQTVPYTGLHRYYCIHHLRIYAALRILRAEGYCCPNCGVATPDVELVSDLADAIAGIPQL